MEEFIDTMDACSVGKALLCARAPWGHQATRPTGPFTISQGVADDVFDQLCAEQSELTTRFAGRLYGSVMVDPLGVSRSYRQVERAVKEYGCKAVRIMPSMSGLPIDHPLYYPIYAKCDELKVPLTVNLGVPGPWRPARLQQPMLLDDVLLAFPELKIVGTHIGHPWHLETVALLQKHPNFFLMTSGWAPKYVPAEIIHFLNTRGAHQVMWASDFPLVGIERATQEARELPIKAEVFERYARDNCLEIFDMT
jgi:predicted TIM-barrel fold metal-dependent hydrolase